MMQKIAFTIYAMVVSFLIVSFFTVASYSTKSTPAPAESSLYAPTVRLHRIENGYFTCSGTVVSLTRIVTAAHCLGGRAPNDPIVRQFEIRGSDNIPLGVVAKVEGFGNNTDQAILSGNFKMFDTRNLQTDPKEVIRKFTEPGRDLIVCGYPLSGPLFCSPLTHVKQRQFNFAGTGFMWPGMSGGPVIDTKTNEVIGVNTGVLLDNTGETTLILTPTINTYEETHTTK